MSTAPMYTVHGSPTRAQAAALATPCCPAPVSAITRRAPSRRASSACPSALLILCAPVCARSSRLSHSSAPQRAESLGAGVNAVGRPDPLAQLSLQLALKVSVAEPAARPARVARAPGSVSRAHSARRTARSDRAHRESGRRAAHRAPARVQPRLHQHHVRSRRRHGPLCTNSRIISGLLRPGADSTPLDTSTPKGRTVCTAAATFAAFKPPGKNQLALTCEPLGLIPVGQHSAAAPCALV